MSNEGEEARIQVTVEVIRDYLRSEFKGFELTDTLEGSFHHRGSALGAVAVGSHALIKQRVAEAVYQVVRTRLNTMPHFPTVTVHNARQGFLEYDTFQAVRSALPAHLRPLITVAYWTGWRRSELLRLEWRQVNHATGEASLDPGTTKNKASRMIFLPPEALEALRDWRQYTLTLERAHQRLISSVFHLNGRPIKKFYRSWRTATKLAKVPGQLFHDLRRSSVRNYVRSGIPERVVMAISGHKTRSIFDRYNIVSPGDLQAAASRVTAVRTGEELGKLVELLERRSGSEAR